APARRDLRRDVALGDRGVRRRDHDHELQRVARGDADRARGDLARQSRPAGLRRLRRRVRSARPRRRGRVPPADGVLGRDLARADAPRRRPGGPPLTGRKRGRRGRPPAADYPLRIAAASVTPPLRQLPNALTVARFALIPVFVVLIWDAEGGHDWAAGIVFGVAAVTDQVDGWLARRWRVESQFGKYADPLADRLMIDAAVLLLFLADRLPWAALAIVVARDLVLVA